VLGVLALLGGFAGGFAAGRAVDDDDGRDPVVVESVGGGAAGSSEPASGADDGAVAATIVSSGGWSAAPSEAGPMPERERLFRRDTPAGLSVRVTGTDYAGDDCVAAGGGWCPPPECVPTSFLDAWVVGEWDVAQGGAPRWALPPDRQARVLGTISSWVPGDRVFGVFVATADDVDTVRLHLDGHRDEMAPIDGVAVLAVPDASSESSSPYPAGAVVEVVAGGVASALAIDAAFTSDPACTPPPPAPPSLPSAGEQPADATAALGEVEAAFRHAFGPDPDDGVIDDPTGLEELRVTLREKYPEMLGGRISYEISDIVFTSPTSAAFYFRPVITDYAQLPQQIGGARVVDGSWKITRDTACSMFRLGGVTC
jgi:hypothetical protein